ncbi:MAG: hypothetical protein LBH60_02745 [Prevotellaceae bacterium]|nr:hypothetical protein [Prevotellaceae bacterium]
MEISTLLRALAGCSRVNAGTEKRGDRTQDAPGVFVFGGENTSTGCGMAVAGNITAAGGRLHSFAVEN